MNRYSYVMNDPLNYIDPSGHRAETEGSKTSSAARIAAVNAAKVAKVSAPKAPSPAPPDVPETVRNAWIESTYNNRGTPSIPDPKDYGDNTPQYTPTMTTEEYVAKKKEEIQAIIERYYCSGEADKIEDVGDCLKETSFIGLKIVLDILEKQYQENSYLSADEAAVAFAKEIYAASLYIRHEYSAGIYSVKIGENVYYNYTIPREGNPHSVLISSTTTLGTMVAYVHTHPNSNEFSKSDKDVAEKFSIDAYVISPNFKLQKYNASDGTTVIVAIVFPNELTEAQKSSLEAEFQDSWEDHVAGGCAFNCSHKNWPTT